MAPGGGIHFRVVSGRIFAFLCLCMALAAPVASAGADPFSSTVVMSVAYRSDCTFTVALEGDIEADTAAVGTATIPPGPYQLTITTPLPDNTWNTAFCDNTNFSLSGPGVSYTAAVGTGSGPNGATTQITLQPASTYTMVDATHPNQPIVITTTATGSSSSLLPTTMSSAPLPITVTRQSDLVGSGAAATAPPFRGTLHATVAASGRLTATYGGTPLGSLKAGRYTLVFRDVFAGGAVELRRSGGGTQTLAARSFRGTRGVSLTLGAGHWTLDASPAHAVRFAVSG
jgi:hypothetical protein